MSYMQFQSQNDMVPTVHYTTLNLNGVQVKFPETAKIRQFPICENLGCRTCPSVLEIDTHQPVEQEKEDYWAV